MEPKILVADDSAMVRHLINKFLDGEGYEVVTTSDSANVVDLIDEINPDLVISDIMMPGMDGYTFVRHIRKRKDTGVFAGNYNVDQKKRDHGRAFCFLWYFWVSSETF